MDINLKDSKGFELCKLIRKDLQIPILFISARSSDDIIIALNIGGDDYIKKTYSLSVLLAKVKVVMKRYGKVIQTDENILYDDGYLKIDINKGMVYIYNNSIILKTMEYKLLIYLVKNKGRIITKDELFEKVWEDCIFSLVILIVSLVVIRFRISNNIQDDMQNIGTMKAIGYKNIQIRLAYMIQFVGISIFAIVIGIIISFGILPILTNVFAAQSGMIWNVHESILQMMIPFVVILLLVFVTVLFSTL